MNQLMEEGHSQRKAAQIMEEEAEGKWKAGTIRQMFDRWMATNVATSKKPKTKKEASECEQTHTLDFGIIEAPEEFCMDFEKFYAQVQNAKMEKWRNIKKETALKCANLILTLIEV